MMVDSAAYQSGRGVIVLQGLNVKADGGDGLDELVLLQLEEDRRLARAIQTQGDNSHLNFWANVNPVILKYKPRLRFTKLYYEQVYLLTKFVMGNMIDPEWVYTTKYSSN